MVRLTKRQLQWKSSLAAAHQKRRKVATTSSENGEEAKKICTSASFLEVSVGEIVAPIKEDDQAVHVDCSLGLGVSSCMEHENLSDKLPVDDEWEDLEEPDARKDESFSVAPKCHPLDDVGADEKAKPKENFVQGRRILSLFSIISFCIAISQHAKRCKDFKLQFINAPVKGMKHDVVFKCRCGRKKFRVSSDGGHETLPISRAMSWGLIVAAIGFYAFRALLTALDLPVPSYPSYLNWRTTEKKFIADAKTKSFLDAIEEEKKLAIERGEFAEVDGIRYPAFRVKVDGGWNKRSYGHGHNSNCGVAVIIGARTKKVLWEDVRNRFCLKCKRAANKNITPPDHECFKTWNGTASAMEADIIRKGFERSIPEHGVVYSEFVGDGDSSVYMRVQNVYNGFKVKKMQCCNHLAKNLHKRLLEISNNKVTGKEKVDIPQAERKLPYMKSRFTAVIHEIRRAINFCRQKGLGEFQLGEMIRTVPIHVFGDHSNCNSEFCEPDSTHRQKSNDVPQVKIMKFWRPLEHAVRTYASDSFSLLLGETTNDCGNFMSIACKYLEGKRKNLVLLDLYEICMDAAALAKNVSSFFLPYVYSVTQTGLPSASWTKLESTCDKIRMYERKSGNQSKRTRIPTFGFIGKQDPDYGKACNEPDLEEGVLATSIASLRDSLQVTAEEQATIEKATRGQANSQLWFTERSSRITASDCGVVCKRRVTTSSKSFLNSKIEGCPQTTAIEWGKDNEKTAVRMYEKLNNTIVQAAGFVISLVYGWLGASTDGWVEEFGILEVKCPFSLKDVPKSDWGRNAIFTEKNGTLALKKSHNYYYQIVMQLIVTGKAWCDFFVWSPTGWHQERIYNDEHLQTFWNTECLPKLAACWELELAPEIVNSRRKRNMPYRERAGAKNSL